MKKRKRMAMEEKITHIGKYMVVRAIVSDQLGRIYECQYTDDQGKVKIYFLALVDMKDRKKIEQYYVRREMEVVLDQCYYKLVVRDHFPYKGDYTCIPMEAQMPEITLFDPESQKDRRFRKTRYIGEVAAGTVYKVERISEPYEEPRIYGSGVYALCVLNLNLKPEYQALPRFDQQAEIQSTLQHKHMQKVHYCQKGKGRDDNWYILMDFKMGKPLSAYVGQLSVLDTLSILQQMSSVLQYVHANKIIHRDVKPRNILYPKKGLSYLTGFFFAKRFDLRESLIRTTEGITIGTMEYFSPEQAQGLPLDARSDIYSLGVTIYVALTGAFPYQSQNKKQMMQAVLSQPLPELSKHKKLNEDPQRLLLPDIDQILQKMTQKNPQDRYSSLNEVENICDLLSGKKKITTSFFRMPEEGKIEMKFSDEKNRHSTSKLLVVGAILALMLGVLGGMFFEKLVAFGYELLYTKVLRK